MIPRDVPKPDPHIICAIMLAVFVAVCAINAYCNYVDAPSAEVAK